MASFKPRPKLPFFSQVLDFLESNVPPRSSLQSDSQPESVLHAARSAITHTSELEVAGMTRTTFGGVPTRRAKVDHSPSSPSLRSRQSLSHQCDACAIGSRTKIETL